GRIAPVEAVRALQRRIPAHPVEGPGRDGEVIESIAAAQHQGSRAGAPRVSEPRARTEIMLADRDQIARQSHFVGSNPFNADIGMAVGDRLGSVAALDKLRDGDIVYDAF